MDDKIKFIDNLLENEDELEDYIKKIENEKIEVAKDLDSKITNSIEIIYKIQKENNDKLNIKQKSTYKFTDLVKVACFALISVLSWEIGIRQIDNMKNQYYVKDNIDIIKEESKKDKYNITEKLSEFMMGEIIKGGEEK